MALARGPTNATRSARATDSLSPGPLAAISPSVPTPQRSGSGGVLAGVVGLAVVILVVVVVVLAITGGDSTDTPPGTDVPATDAPAVEDAPASDDATDG